MLKKINEDNEFIHLWISDEDYFNLNVYVVKQNFVIGQNPTQLQQCPLHIIKFTL